MAEPPKIEAANNLPQTLLPAGTPKAPPPPQIQSQENPKLAFETPGQRGTSAETTQPPKLSVDEAIRKTARPNEQTSGIVVGDLDQPPNIPDSARLPPSPDRPGSTLWSC